MKDITGQKFNKLTAVSFSHKETNIKESHTQRRYFWNFKCDCGSEIIRNRNSVTTGQTSSCGCNHGLEDFKASLNHFYRGYVKGAEKRDIKFDLTIEQFEEITSHNCHYCNALPLKERKGTPFLNGFYKGNGVDRKENYLGYSATNCVPCCETCNFAKRSMNYNEFKSWISRVYENLNVVADSDE